VKVRRRMVVEEHSNEDPVEGTDRWHSARLILTLNEIRDAMENCPIVSRYGVTPLLKDSGTFSQSESAVAEDYNDLVSGWREVPRSPNHYLHELRISR
jgi:hypothetical protein